MRFTTVAAAIILCGVTALGQPALSPIIIDHTPAAPAEDVPEVLADLALPQGALDRLTEIHSADEGVCSVQVAWLSGDRYLWRVELPEALEEGKYVNLYINTDADEAT
ncbi:MAG: hypothetical protein ACOCZ7_04530, partial [Armatimonadota bacterium]